MWRKWGAVDKDQCRSEWSLSTEVIFAMRRTLNSAENTLKYTLNLFINTLSLKYRNVFPWFRPSFPFFFFFFFFKWNTYLLFVIRHHLGSGEIKFEIINKVEFMVVYVIIMVVTLWDINSELWGIYVWFDFDLNFI